MKTRSVWCLRRAAPALILLFAAFASAQGKRPLTHKDYDSWRNIQNQTFSRDGRFLAYGLFPQQGDGEVIVRNLQTGTEWRQSAGARPEPSRPNPGSEEPPATPTITLCFTPDSHFVVFSVFPPKAEMDKAKKEKKKPEEMPNSGMVIMDLTSGAAARVARVKSFQVPEKANGVLAYLREPEMERPSAAKGDSPGEEASQTRPGEAKKGEKKKEYGSQLVLRNLVAQTERTFPDVLEYTLSKDAATLVYTAASRKEETNGLYASMVGSDAPSRALLAGHGKYSKLAWDEQQTQLAFLSDRDDRAAKQPKFKLYLWQRSTETPAELVSATTPGFRDAFVISDKGPVHFSRDGQRVFFGCAPPLPDKEDSETDGTGDEREKVSFDLWHWKDEHIQPMQKARAQQEKTRTYRAVYHLQEKKMVQLADRAMPEITLSENGLWALGSDDREYRPILEYDTQYTDYYLVDTLSGDRRQLVKKHLGNLVWSPDGRYVVYFSDRNWVTVSVPERKATVLTPKQGVNFWREDYDMPGTPPPYGFAGWTKDGKYVLLYDQFDIWRMTPDGSEAVNLTRGAGRQAHLEFRHVRLNPDSRDPEAKWIDASQPLLLRAMDKETYDTGFYRTRMDARDAPQKLLFAAKSFSAPVKAKDADVLVLAASTFEEFPDLEITDSSFTKLKKVTDANPQKAQFLWGTAELMRYRNADGVPLKGILYKPENFDPNKRYPLLVYIYERLSQNLHAFVVPRPSHSINPTYYVSNGYLVLEPDIAYTIGQPGQSALKCVLPAIDSLVARRFVDEKAIGIQGHSWGGYQIAYMITQTNRFRAVAAGAPVANMTSAYDGIRWGPGLPRQFQYERSQSRIGGNLWQVPLKYIENSPVFMADRVNTPLLMLHNDSDDAVPWYQGIEYYLALRRLGKEVYLFTYNGEPHGLLRRVNQRDYTVRLQQYFDYYLKGALEPAWMKDGIPYLDRDEEKERLKRQTGMN